MPDMHPERAEEVQKDRLIIQFIPEICLVRKEGKSTTWRPSVYESDDTLKIDNVVSNSDDTLKEVAKEEEEGCNIVQDNDNVSDKAKDIVHDNDDVDEDDVVGPRNAKRQRIEDEEGEEQIDLGPEPYDPLAGMQNQEPYIPLDPFVAAAISIPEYTPTPIRSGAAYCRHGVKRPTHRIFVKKDKKEGGTESIHAEILVFCSECPTPKI